MDELDANIAALVDRIFEPAAAVPFNRTATNPVTEGNFVSGRDPIEPEKEIACLALAARHWFSQNGPADAPLLPISYNERERLKARFCQLPRAERRREFDRIVAWFARSLASRNYNFKEHPSFADYARGVLASPYAPDQTKSDDALARRYPPKALAGLGPGLYWAPVG